MEAISLWPTAAFFFASLPFRRSCPILSKYPDFFKGKLQQICNPRQQFRKTAATYPESTASNPTSTDNFRPTQSRRAPNPEARNPTSQLHRVISTFAEEWLELANRPFGSGPQALTLASRLHCNDRTSSSSSSSSLNQGLERQGGAVFRRPPVGPISPDQLDSLAYWRASISELLPPRRFLLFNSLFFPTPSSCHIFRSTQRSLSSSSGRLT